MSRLSESRIAVSTRPTFERMMERDKTITDARYKPVIANSAACVPGSAMRKPRMRLKSVNPLLPPKPVSLRKNSSMKAKVSACVMMEKYTPFTRERNAKNPKTKASSPGASTTSSAEYQKWSVNDQYHGYAFQSRNTM